MSKKGKKQIVYAFIDSQNLNLGTRKDVYSSYLKTPSVSLRDEDHPSAKARGQATKSLEARRYH